MYTGLWTQVISVRVKVKFFAHFMCRAGRDQMELNLSEGSSVENLLDILGKTLGPPFSNWAAEVLSGGVWPAVWVIKNNRVLMMPEEIKSTLAEGDVISFVPPLEGG